MGGPLVTTLILCLSIAKIQCEDVDSTMSQFDVIVVGLGASGVSALSSLARAGKAVLGLEAADRLGGRVNTVEFGRGIVELGAEWIHGENPSRVYDLAVEHNVPIRKQYLDMDIYRSDGSKVDHELCDELMAYCFELIEHPPDLPQPLGLFITKKFHEHISDRPALVNDTDFVDQFLDFVNLMVNNYEASNDWNDVTTASNYEELEGHQHWSWHRLGYRTLFDILLNTYNNGTRLPVDIKLSKEATKIKWSTNPEDNVTVYCEDGTSYVAKTVIVTVSLGVLKARHQQLFEPQLPQEKIHAINNISMGVMDKVIFSYETVWWPSNLTFFGFVWKGADKDKVSDEDKWITRIYGFSSPLGSENAITLWTSGETAKLVETLPEDVVRRKCTELLRKFMGPQVPEPDDMVRTTWYSNPLTRGSYSFDSVQALDGPAARAALAAPILDTGGEPRLLFAGEATNQKHFSTVHGAVETGAREAALILNYSNDTNVPHTNVKSKI